MSDPTQAIDFVLRQEDSILSGVITNTPGDSGGTTRFGLAAKWHPELVADGFYDASMDAATALPLAENAYQTAYATPLRLVEIDAQTIANALLSFSVNCGIHSAVETIQNICQVTADGLIGPATIAAINAQDAPTLLAAYCALQKNNYRAIASQNVSDEAFLQGWLNRVDAIANQTA